MKIKSQRTTTYTTSYRLSFTYITSEPGFRGAGYSFECDKEGNVDVSKLHPCAQESYKKCLSGTSWVMVGMMYDWVRDPKHPEGGEYVNVLCTGRWVEMKLRREILEETNRQVEPAVGECNHCGHDVVLYGFTNTCDHCHTDYNMSGQELAPRSQWGEETGESVSDILSVDNEGYDNETPWGESHSAF